MENLATQVDAALAEAATRSPRPDSRSRRAEPVQSDALRRSGAPSRIVELIESGRTRWSSERHQAKARAATEAIEADRGAIVALLGERGHGKSVLACILAHNWSCARSGASWSYWRLGMLLAAARERFDDRTALDVMADAYRAPLLVLDEIQERRHTDWEDEQFTTLLDVRYGDQRPTILIGNLGPAELESYSPSVASRMQEVGRVVVCDWGDLRARGGAA